MASIGKGISGTLPEFGAIFMCNMKTKEECFDRKIFGLPFVASQFVDNVKAGMVLFLFEFEKRKLYGVFEAVSDGGINIVPHAYHSSGKSFPAQVQFRIIWRCKPLRERDFHDAISENYYAAYKFNFGLSKDQVHRLLCLFNSRRIKVQKSLGENKVKKWPSETSDDQNPSVDPDELSGENFDYPCSSEPYLSVDAEESSFQQPTASTTNSSITAPPALENLSVSGNQHVQLLKETELVDVSSSPSFTLGDFIPLSSQDNCEPVETEVLLRQSNLDGSSALPAQDMGPCDSSASVLKGTEIMDISSIALLDFGDFIPLSSPDNCEPVETEVLLGRTNLDVSSALPTLDMGPCDSKHELCPEHNPRVKGLYSDALERTSVFSRLKLNAQCAPRENGDNFGTPNRNAAVSPHSDLDFTKKRQRSFMEDESLELIMENLLQRQKSWMKKIGKVKSNRIQKSKNSKRASVFSRLNINSEVTKQEKEVRQSIFYCRLQKHSR